MLSKLGKTNTSTHNVNGCEDRTQSNGCAWYDEDGREFSCSLFYEERDADHCGDHGDEYANFGMTASQACCACGGGEGTWGKAIFSSCSANPLEGTPIHSYPTRAAAVTACNNLDTCYGFQDRDCDGHYQEDGNDFFLCGESSTWNTSKTSCVYTKSKSYGVPTPAPTYWGSLAETLKATTQSRHVAKLAHKKTTHNINGCHDNPTPAPTYWGSLAETLKATTQSRDVAHSVTLSKLEKTKATTYVNE
jgi:hypothetical protein